MNLPNIITLFRFLLIPVVMFFLIKGQYAWALVLFLLASLSDGLDGYLARRLNQRTRLGAILDPLADKFLVVAVVVVLTYLHRLPLWLSSVIILRDLVIVSGALIYHKFIAPVEMRPSALSKVNTALQFALLVVVLAQAAEWLSLGHRLIWLFWLILASTVLSGMDYVRRWGTRAIVARRLL